MFTCENLTTLIVDGRNRDHVITLTCLNKYVWKVGNSSGACVRFKSAWMQRKHDASLGLFPAGTLCQIERPSADRPRSSLDRACVRQNPRLYSHACVRLCVANMGECTHVWFCLCVCVSHIHCVCMCAGESPKVAIHLDSLRSPITSLSRHSLTRTSDGRSPEGEGGGVGVEWMTETDDRSHRTHREKVLWHTNTPLCRERGGRRVAVKAKQNKSESASISSVDIGLIGSLRWLDFLRGKWHAASISTGFSGEERWTCASKWWQLHQPPISFFSSADTKLFAEETANKSFMLDVICNLKKPFTPNYFCWLQS